MTKTASRGRIQIGSFTWISSAELETWRAEDEESDTTAQECFTCQNIVTGPYHYCAENAEIVCQGCRIPDFDRE